MSIPVTPRTSLAVYAKALVYVALAIVSVAITALSDDVISTEEILNAVVIALGALVVYVVPNMPEGVARYSKGIAAFATAGVVALISFLSGGVTVSEWLQVAVAAAAGVGVVLTPNANR